MGPNSNELKIVVRALDQATATLKKIRGEVDTTAKRTSRIGEVFRNNYQAAGVAATGLLAGLGAVTMQGFRFNSAIEQSTAKINAFTKDSAKTAEILRFVKSEAANTQFSFQEMADAASGLIPAAKSSGVALETLVRQAEVLAALNPAEGLTGAAFSLREALSGDFVSIVERFNLPRKRLNELKEQGVPAIEAVRIALAEMGIDFDLVAKQGETTSAKWAQITDKINMAAGALTGPLFEEVGNQLGRLNPILDQLQPKAEALGKWMAENKIVIFALAGVIGGLLVAALAALIAAFGSAIAIAGVFAAIGAALGAVAYVLIRTWNDFKTSMIAIWNAVVAAVRWAVDTTIRNALSVASPFINAFNAVKYAALAAFQFIGSISWGQAIGNIGRGIGNTIVALIEGAINGALKGIPGSPKIKIPRFAQGVENFRGGLAIVGERGPELAYLPKGSSVFSHQESRRMAGTTINQTNNIYNQVDLDAANRELGWRLANV